MLPSVHPHNFGSNCPICTQWNTNDPDFRQLFLFYQKSIWLKGDGALAWIAQLIFCFVVHIFTIQGGIMYLKVFRVKKE